MADASQNQPKLLLIAAGSAVGSPEQVPFGVRALIDEADEILVVTPTLPSRLDWLTSATDRAREAADERLDRVLGQIKELGGEAAGTVGADDPLLAFEDALRDFPAGHLLIAIRDSDSAGWQELGLVDQLLERFRRPVTVFVVPGC